MSIQSVEALYPSQNQLATSGEVPNVIKLSPIPYPSVGQLL